MIDLSQLTNMFGSVSESVQKRIEALIREPNAENWDDAHSIIVDGSATLWQYVCLIDSTFPRSTSIDQKTYETIWKEIPSRDILIKALELAQDNCENNLYYAAGEIRESKAKE